MTEETQKSKTAEPDNAPDSDNNEAEKKDYIGLKFPDELELAGENEQFERMPLLQRIQHIFLMTCFFTLVLTGLPILLHNNSFVQSIFDFEGGFALRGLLHRAAGIGLMIVSAVQLTYIIFTKDGRRDFFAIIPGPKDAFDAVHTFMHNLGSMSYFKKKGYFPELFKKYPWISFEDEPLFGKYNFIEKFEYFALLWGNLIMIMTGLMMWYIEISLTIFPKWILDVVRVVHGFEALLALLSIVIWHMYNVHLNPEVFPMSRIWLTGKISRRELKKHHPMQYEQILLERRKQRQASVKSDNV